MPSEDIPFLEIHDLPFADTLGKGSHLFLECRDLRL